MSFGGAVMKSTAIDRVYLAKLKRSKHFSKELDKYLTPKDVLNLKKPSAEVLLSNRKEVENYKSRKRVINLIFVALGFAIFAMIMLKIS